MPRRHGQGRAGDGLNPSGGMGGVPASVPAHAAAQARGAVAAVRAGTRKHQQGRAMLAKRRSELEGSGADGGPRGPARAVAAPQQQTVQHQQAPHQPQRQTQQGHGAASRGAAARAPTVTAEEPATLDAVLQELILKDQPGRERGTDINISPGINVIISKELESALATASAAAGALDTKGELGGRVRRATLAVEAAASNGGRPDAAELAKLRAEVQAATDAKRQGKANLDEATAAARVALVTAIAETKAEGELESDRRERNSKAEGAVGRTPRAGKPPLLGVSRGCALDRRKHTAAVKAGAVPPGHDLGTVYPVVDAAGKSTPPGLYKYTAAPSAASTTGLGFVNGQEPQRAQVQAPQPVIYTWHTPKLGANRGNFDRRGHTIATLADRTQKYAVAAFKDYVKTHVADGTNRSDFRAEPASKEIKEAFKKYYLSGEAAKNLTAKEYTCMSWMVSNAVAEEAREAVQRIGNGPATAAAIDGAVKRIIAATLGPHPSAGRPPRQPEEAFVLGAASPATGSEGTEMRLEDLRKMERGQPAEMVANAPAKALEQNLAGAQVHAAARQLGMRVSELRANAPAQERSKGVHAAVATLTKATDKLEKSCGGAGSPASRELIERSRQAIQAVTSMQNRPTGALAPPARTAAEAAVRELLSQRTEPEAGASASPGAGATAAPPVAGGPRPLQPPTQPPAAPSGQPTSWEVTCAEVPPNSMEQGITYQLTQTPEQAGAPTPIGSPISAEQLQEMFTAAQQFGLAGHYPVVVDATAMRAIAAATGATRRAGACASSVGAAGARCGSGSWVMLPGGGGPGTTTSPTVTGEVERA